MITEERLSADRRVGSEQKSKTERQVVHDLWIVVVERITWNYGL